MATAAIDVRAAEGAHPSLIKPESQTQVVIRRFRKHKLAVVSLALLTIIFVASA